MNTKVTRYIYMGELAKPLRVGETAESKLPALMAYLGVTTHSDGAVAMLLGHVIGHNVRDYPLSLRGSPKTGLTAEKRMPYVRAYFGVTNDHDAFLALAIKHVSGFRPKSILRNGGPPGQLAASKSNLRFEGGCPRSVQIAKRIAEREAARNDLIALEELCYERTKDWASHPEIVAAMKANGDHLKLAIATVILRDPRFSKIDPASFVERCQKKRFTKEFLRWQRPIEERISRPLKDWGRR